MVSLYGSLGKLIQIELGALRDDLDMASSLIPLFQILCKPIRKNIIALVMIRDICVQLMITQGVLS